MGWEFPYYGGIGIRQDSILQVTCMTSLAMESVIIINNCIRN